MNRSIFIAPLRILAIVPLAATFAAAFGHFHWLLDIFTAFHLQYAIALTVIGLLLMTFRRIVLAAIVVIGLLWNGILIGTHYSPRPTPDQPQATVLRLVSFNVHSSNTNHNGVLQNLQQQDADIILLLEVNNSWVRDLETLKATHPFHFIASREDNFGLALYSRLPMTAEIAMFGQAMPSISATLAMTTTSGSKPIHIIGTHPLPPTGPNYARLRNRQLAAIADVIAHTSLSELYVVAGDFNASPWSTAMKPLLKRANLHDTAAGFGVNVTWSAFDPIPAISAPIDYVLVSPSIASRTFTVGPNLGSDHRPIIATLSIA